jgi:hypothetical protein
VFRHRWSIEGVRLEKTYYRKLEQNPGLSLVPTGHLVEDLHMAEDETKVHILHHLFSER